MVARTLSATRDDTAIWTVRGVGLVSGLAAVLGAVMLGWLTWPALVGGLVGGTALIAYLALGGRTGGVSRGTTHSVRRGIRPLVSSTPADPDTRIAA